jgi:hypothetical protein
MNRGIGLTFPTGLKWTIPTPESAYRLGEADMRACGCASVEFARSKVVFEI